MTARKVFSIICMCFTALLIIFIFLPLLDLGSYGGEISLWDYLKSSNSNSTSIIIIIELIIAIVAYILQLTGVTDDAKLAYLGLGYYTTYHLSLFFTAIANSAVSQLAFGFWLGFIFSLTAVILTFIGGFVNNKAKPKYYGYSKPVRYDPQTGEPIYEKQNKIVGYDPQTGDPIFE